VERGQRIGLIVAALVVAVVGIVLISSGGDDDDAGSSSTGTQETRPQEPTATVPGPKPKPKPQFETITIAGGEPKGGAKEITLQKGDTARIAVRSDTAGEVHVHGYDLMKDVEAGGAIRLRFKADIEGIFEIELEETKTELATLVVEP
jgi:hypothetical protein